MTANEPGRAGRDWITAVSVDANGPHVVVASGRGERHGGFPFSAKVGELIFCYDDDPSLCAGFLGRITGIRPGHGDPKSRCFDVEPVPLVAVEAILNMRSKDQTFTTGTTTITIAQQLSEPSS